MGKKIGLYNFKDSKHIKQYFTGKDVEMKDISSLENTDDFDFVFSHNCIDKIDKNIINVHPSLLPAYPDKDAVTKVFCDGVKVSGITIHSKTKIIAQYPVLIGLETHIDDFINEMHEVENKLLPVVIDSIINDRIFDFKDLFSNPCHVGGCSNCRGCH